MGALCAPILSVKKSYKAADFFDLSEEKITIQSVPLCIEKSNRAAGELEGTRPHS